MSQNDDQPTAPLRAAVHHPVVVGLAALVGVSLAIGLILGGVALVAARVTGLDGGSSVAVSTGQASMYLPQPAPTERSSGPAIQLNTTAPTADATDRTDAPATQTPDKAINLAAGVTEVAPMGQIDLTGDYPGGEGAILQVQKFSGGGWQDFPVTVVVSGGQFSTYVQTSSVGVNRFRVVDSDTDLASNEVRVTVR